MTYVGIDQSYSGFGIVVWLPTLGDEQVYLGRFEPKKYGTGVDRLRAIEDWITRTLDPFEIDHVCMEGYASASKFGREQAGELGYAVKRTLRFHGMHGVYPTIVPPTALKKFVTGSGTAKKNEMLLGVYKRWGMEFSDDNLADAYALARLAEALDTAPELPKFQQEVIERLTPHTEMRR